MPFSPAPPIGPSCAGGMRARARSYLALTKACYEQGMLTDEPASARVLVVEDDRAVRESLDRALRLSGYEVAMASDGFAALRQVDEREPDAILLDLMMPGIDGLEVCRRLRADGYHTPILVLTARDAVADRVAGLDAGADDYLPKPFALEELLARLRALLRRVAPADGDADVLRVADLTLDLRRREAVRGERTFELTKTEFDLLELLLRNQGIVLAREVIYDRIWGYDFGVGSKSLDVYIGYLRRKTEAAGEPRLIHTVRGVGYTLRAPGEP
jgi:two-component system response regulator MprA